MSGHASFSGLASFSRNSSGPAAYVQNTNTSAGVALEAVNTAPTWAAIYGRHVASTSGYGVSGIGGSSAANNASGVDPVHLGGLDSCAVGRVCEEALLRAHARRDGELAGGAIPFEAGTTP